MYSIGMNWLPYLGIFFFAVLASFYGTKEFKPKTNKTAGLIGSNLLFVTIIVNFFINGWLHGLVGIVTGFMLYSIAKRSHSTNS